MNHEPMTGVGSPGIGAMAVNAIVALALWAFAALCPPPAYAGMMTRTAFELSLLAGYSDEIGRVHELPGSQRSSVGFEQLAKFSGERGDVVTTDLQVRMSYDSQAPSGDAWAVELHNAWLEYRLGLGKKIRFGHFSPAHGLETIRDTHGTLTQTLAGMDIGFKKDWGIEYSGLAGPVDLEFALQLGSGMAPAPNDGSYLASAQIWTPSGRDSRFGLSILHGELRSGGQPRTFPLPEYADGTVGKSRAGIAAERTAGSFTMLAEASAGWNDSLPVGGVLIELAYVPPSRQQLRFEWQLRVWDGNLERGDTGIVAGLAGAAYQLTDAVTARAAVTATGRDGNINETRVTAQLYYYGG